MDTQWGKEFCKLVLGNMTEADIEHTKLWFSFLKLTCGKEAETGERVWHGLVCTSHHTLAWNYQALGWQRMSYVMS